MIVDIFGDVHGDFKKLGYLFEYTIPHPNIIICCGDFGYWPNMLMFQDLKKINFRNTKVYFIDGNHENHIKLANLGVNNEIHKNVFYMKRGTILPIKDKNILFMGGANSIDKHLRTPGFDWFPEENISEADMNNFEKNYKIYEKIDIVISHTCPNEFNMLDAFNLKIHEDNRDKLSYILNKIKPKEWYFGHWHEFKIGKYKNTKWTSLGSNSSQKFKTRIEI